MRRRGARRDCRMHVKQWLLVVVVVDGGSGGGREDGGGVNKVVAGSPLSLRRQGCTADSRKERPGLSVWAHDDQRPTSHGAQGVQHRIASPVYLST